MNYKEYLEQLNDTTRKFVKEVFPYLYYSVYNNTSSDYTTKSGYTISGKKQKILVSFLLALVKSEVSNDFLEDLNFSGTLNVEDKPPYDTEFEICKKYFLCDSKLDRITPNDIIRAVVNDMGQDSLNNLCNYLGIRDIKACIKKQQNKESISKGLEIEKRLFYDIDIKNINVIKEATRIRKALKKGLKDKELKETEYLKDSDKYLVPVSILLSLLSTDNDIKEKLKSNGLSYETVAQTIGVVNFNWFKGLYGEVDLVAVDMLYQDYIRNSASDIFNTILDRNITGSVAIETILNKLDLGLDDFEDLGKIDEKFNDFNDELVGEVKFFLIEACKTYQLLVKQFEDGKLNSDLIRGLDDIDTLAMFITSQRYRKNISSFFESKGITYDKVRELVKFEFDSNELQSVIVDKNVYMERFTIFANSGVNDNKELADITILDLERNLCDRDFNDSAIMELLFTTILVDKKLTNGDFIDEFDEYVNQENLKKLRALKKEVLNGIPLELYDDLIVIIQVYDYLVTNFEIDPEAAVAISIIYCGLHSENKELVSYLEELGYDESTIVDYFDIDFDYTENEDLDVDTLKDKFLKLLAGVNNFEDLLANLFVPSKYNNFEFNLFMKRNKISKFELIKFTDYKKEHEEENKKLSLIEKYADILGCSSTEYTNVYMSLANYSNPHRNYIALLMAILYSNKEDIYEKINENLGIEDAEYSKVDDLKAFDYDVFVDGLDIETILNNIFTDSEVLRLLAENNINYEAILFELKTGKDYESSISIDDRIISLNNLAVPVVSSSSERALLSYSDALTPHTTYINNKYSEAALATYDDDATKKVHDLLEEITKVTSFQPKTVSFWDKLFGTVEDDEPTKSTSEIVTELTSTIDEQSEIIRQQILIFSDLKDYLKAYRLKHGEFTCAIDDKVVEAERKLIALSQNSNVSSLDLFEARTALSTLKAVANNYKDSDKLIEEHIKTVILILASHMKVYFTLQKAKDTLVPLIQSHMIIDSGLGSENTAGDISTIAVNLFKALLEKNVDGVTSNLTRLEQTSLSREEYAHISDSILELVNPDSDLELLEAKYSEPEVIEPLESTDGLEVIEPIEKESRRKK